MLIGLLYLMGIKRHIARCDPDRFAQRQAKFCPLQEPSRKRVFARFGQWDFPQQQVLPGVFTPA